MNSLAAKLTDNMELKRCRTRLTGIIGGCNEKSGGDRYLS